MLLYHAENYHLGKIEWIKTDNISPDSLFVQPAQEMLSAKGQEKGRVVKKGALLMACIAGSIKSIGRVAITDRTVAFNQQINAIQPNQDVDSYFLYTLLKLSKEYIQTHTSKGMKKILTKGKFVKIKIIKPPFILQKQFALIFKKVEVIKSRYQQSLEELENLYGSLSQRAFRGELG